MIAIISDIHGNYEALKAVFKDLDKYRPDLIISLGDVAGYYLQLNECVDLLRERKVINIMGNHDFYLVSGAGCPRSNSANRFLIDQAKIATTETMDWLKKSSSCYITDELSMVHGGWNNPMDEYLYKINTQYFDRFPQKFFFSGHTHVQAKIKLENEKVFCNPGSVGQPRDGISSAAYALLDNNEIQLKRVEYDIDALVQVMKDANYEEYFYENLYSGTRLGGKVDQITFEPGK